MHQVTRFGKVLGTILGHRDPAKTKAAAVERFGRGVTIHRVL